MNIKLPLDISRDFIYSCMGFGSHEPDPASLELIDTCCRLVLDAAVPRMVYRAFPLEQASPEGPFYIGNSQYSLEGQAITHHLQDCTHCVLLAVTVGVQVDGLIRKAQVTDMAKAVALDACASSLIEDLCDQANEKLAAAYGQQGLELTSRFSPGYGDFPLEAQQLFSNLLQMEKKIGLTHSREYLLLPRKSVTAVMGLFPANQSQFGGSQPGNAIRACDTCAMRETCTLRASGGYCGKKV